MLVLDTHSEDSCSLVLESSHISLITFSLHPFLSLRCEIFHLYLEHLFVFLFYSLEDYLDFIFNTYVKFHLFCQAYLTFQFTLFSTVCQAVHSFRVSFFPLFILILLLSQSFLKCSFNPSVSNLRIWQKKKLHMTSLCVWPTVG